MTREEAVNYALLMAAQDPEKKYRRLVDPCEWCQAPAGEPCRSLKDPGTYAAPHTGSRHEPAPEQPLAVPPGAALDSGVCVTCGGRDYTGGRCIVCGANPPRRAPDLQQARDARHALQADVKAAIERLRVELAYMLPDLRAKVTVRYELREMERSVPADRAARAKLLIFQESDAQEPCQCGAWEAMAAGVLGRDVKPGSGARARADVLEAFARATRAQQDALQASLRALSLAEARDAEVARLRAALDEEKASHAKTLAALHASQLPKPGPATGG